MTVRKLSLETFEINVCNEDSIDNLKKKKIQDIEGMPPDSQRLMYTGKQLEDERTVGYYQIKPGSVLHLVSRLSGC